MRNGTIKCACAVTAAGMLLAMGTRALADNSVGTDDFMGWTCRTDINANPAVEVTVWKRGTLAKGTSAYYSVRAVSTNPVAGPVVVTEVDQARESIDAHDVVYQGSSADGDIELSISQSREPAPAPYPELNTVPGQVPGLPSVLKITHADQNSAPDEVYEAWCTQTR